MDNFQYELPEDFEDEEIDEEMAFTEEDKQKMAKIAQKTEDADGLDSEEPLTRDDFSDDVRTYIKALPSSCSTHVQKSFR